MENEWDHNEELTPLPEHIFYPEYTPEYPDVTFFKESSVTMREENIFQGEHPPGESPRDLREERKKKRSRWAWFRRFLGCAMRGGAALAAVLMLVANAAETKDSYSGHRVKGLIQDLHENAFALPNDYTPRELASLWKGDPLAPHQYDFDHLVVIREATCKEPGLSCYVCTECDVRLIHTTTRDHEPAPEVRENIIRPGCDTEGSCEEVIICELCGEELSREPVVLAALGHSGADPVIENVVEPDCTNEGSQEEVVYCSVCGEEISRETVVLEALGHTDDEPVIENVVEPDCTNEGSQEEVVYCSVCGEEVSRETVVLEALGHTEDEAVTENEKDASCTAKGSYDEVIYCSVCGEELSRTTKSTPALGHIYTASATAATCTERGYTTHTCSRCGDSYRDSYTAALGHSYSTSKTAATCTAQGYSTHTCSRCGDSYKDTYTAALGHSYSAKTTAATCSSRGYTTHTCSRCGDSYKDSYVDALPHTKEKPVVENRKDATCTADGSYEQVYYCTVCGGEISRTKETISALGHNYSDTVTAPTCTARGYTTHTCSRCGTVSTDTYTAALGHSFTIETMNWNNTTPLSCSRCGTYALTVSNVSANTFSYSINSDFWNQAVNMGLGFFEWGDCVAYSDGVDVGYIRSEYNEATSPSGTFVLNFTPESGRTYQYVIRLRVAASTSSDDVCFVYPQGGGNRSYTQP